MADRPNSDRWENLLAAAFLLESGEHGPRRLLDSALEVFPGNIEPADDFEGYAVRRFLAALRDSLAR